MPWKFHRILNAVPLIYCRVVRYMMNASGWINGRIERKASTNKLRSLLQECTLVNESGYSAGDEGRTTLKGSLLLDVSSSTFMCDLRTTSRTTPRGWCLQKVPPLQKVNKPKTTAACLHNNSNSYRNITLPTSHIFTSKTHSLSNMLPIEPSMGNYLVPPALAAPADQAELLLSLSKPLFYRSKGFIPAKYTSQYSTTAKFEYKFPSFSSVFPQPNFNHPKKHPSPKISFKSRFSSLVEACRLASMEYTQITTTDSEPVLVMTKPEDLSYDTYMDLESSLLSPPLSPDLLQRRSTSGRVAPVVQPLNKCAVPKTFRQTAKRPVKPALKPVEKPAANHTVKHAVRTAVKPAVKITLFKPASVRGEKCNRMDSKGAHIPCVSCGIRKSPCWRPSWSQELGQLCNSCGLRYRKTHVRCCRATCSHIPSKVELASLMAGGGEVISIKCSLCDSRLCHD